MKEIFINKNGAKTINDFLALKETKEKQEFLVKNIIGPKAPDYTEIEVSFFQLCALHCRFCWQDTYDPTGISSIRDKAEVVLDYLQKQKDKLQPNIQVHMLGGELFEDSNDYYDDYFYFISTIAEYCKKNIPEKKLLFVFLTNMNFQKDETKNKLENFLNQLINSNYKFILTTSWDPTGRPLKGEIDTKFHQNITYFKKHLAEITFVLTKTTINKLLRENIEYLDLLYNLGFKLDFDYYMPTTQVDSLMPSDRDLLNALRLLIKKYPKISKLKAWTQNINSPGKLTCASLNKITILPDGTLTNCRHLNYDQSDFETKIFNESNSDMILNYITKKECLSCNYFFKCPLSCFVMSDHKKFIENKELEECYYKILFRENEHTRNN
jgi:radical SAM protein with 4Fe4S-binding SPASM domain